MTLEDALGKLDALCAEYGIDYVGKTALLAIIMSARDEPELGMGIKIIEDTMKRYGKKE